MRLIDADKIKQSVTNEMLKAELNSPVYRTLECVIADIDNQPTAYNVDKVVERLEELMKAECEEDFDEEYEDGISVGKYRAYTDAVEIVKSGGIE